MTRTLIRDSSGNSVIEMALAAPFLAALLIGMVDLSLGYSTKLQLEQAAQRTIEKVMQQNGMSTNMEAELRTEAAAAAGVAESAVTPNIWLECNGVRRSEFNGECASGETYARYVTVDIVKIYTPIFASRYAGADQDGTYTLHGVAGIRIQ